MNPAEDYRCRHCHELVLYRSDHTEDCVHHPSQDKSMNPNHN